MMRFAMLVPAAFAVPQCGAANSVKDGGTPRDVDRSLTMERSACYGRCPVYSVAISSEGTVRFRGVANVAQAGESVAQIPRARADSLFRFIDSVSFVTLDSAYTYGARGCGPYASDLPTVTVTLAAAGTTKTVKHDYGCSSAPAQLREIHVRIDRATETQRWIGGK